MKLYRNNQVKTLIMRQTDSFIIKGRTNVVRVEIIKRQQDLCDVILEMWM